MKAVQCSVSKDRSELMFDLDACDQSPTEFNQMARACREWPGRM